MTSQSSLTIPEELKRKFSKLIELILGSESMNDEERQYWINMLSVMTPEQQVDLEKILQNEKEQLAAIDQKYAKEMEKLGKGRSIEEMAHERREKRSTRSSKEAKVEEKERQKEEEILREIADSE